MIRRVAYLSLVFLFFILYGLYVSQHELTVVNTGLPRNSSSGFYDYKGVINVQSNLSKGALSPLEIIEEAKKTDVDFLIFTDEDQFSREQNRNAYHGDLLSLSESEYSFLDARVLLFNESANPNLPNSQSAQLYLTDLLSQSRGQTRESFVVMAHPFVRGRPTWTGDLPVGIDAVEILNPKSISAQAYAQSAVSVAWSLFLYPFNWRYSFLRLFIEPTDELSLWDSTSNRRPLFGIAGSNATSRAVILPNYLVQFPSYQKIFELLGNHIILRSELTGNVEKDRSKILTAFKNGNYFLSLDALASPRGFNAVIKQNEKSYLMGSSLAYRNGLTLEALLPQLPDCFFEIVLLKNGERVATSNQISLSYAIKEPGVYRVLVRVIPELPLPDAKKWFTWIYSNPFFIK